MKAAVIFGRNKPKCGCLVELQPEIAFDPHDEGQAEGFRDLLESYLEELNISAPMHGQISKQVSNCVLDSDSS